MLHVCSQFPGFQDPPVSLNTFSEWTLDPIKVAALRKILHVKPRKEGQVIFQGSQSGNEHQPRLNLLEVAAQRTSVPNVISFQKVWVGNVLEINSPKPSLVKGKIYSHKKHAFSTNGLLFDIQHLEQF